MTGPRSSGHGNRTAERAVQVLSLYIESRTTLTAAEVAEHLGMSRSTTYRYLQSLRNARLLEEDPATASFRLGPRIFELAAVARAGLGLSEIAKPIMRQLADETGETVLLTRRSGHHVVCLEREESSQHLRLSYEPGQVLPIHAGASAIVLLAWLGEAELVQVLEAGPLERFTDATICDPEALRARLGEVRKLGYAVTYGERDPGVVGVAAPIRDESDRVVAGLSLVAPVHRVDGQAVKEMITVVCASSDKASERIRLAQG
jgi:DNA-binding IclR family transcriptional regulator